MYYKYLFEDENKSVLERYELSKVRISEIKDEDTVDEKYREYFSTVSSFIMEMCKLYEEIDTYYSKEDNSCERFILDKSLDELKVLNNKLYGDITGENYENSYANPSRCVNLFRNTDEKDPEFMGAFLSFLYTEIRGLITYA